MLLMPFATDCLRNLSESVATLLARADQPTPNRVCGRAAKMYLQAAQHRRDLVCDAT